MRNTEGREFDINTFSERLAAQTEAYVDFSHALVKIIEQTALIRDKINENNAHIIEDYKDIRSKFESLLIEFNKFVSDTAHSHSNFEKDFDSFQNEIKNYQSKLEYMVKELDVKNKELFDIVDKINTTSNHNHMILLAHSEDTSLLLKKSLSETSDIRKWLSRASVYIQVTTAVLGLIGLLIGFGLINITWVK